MGKSAPSAPTPPDPAATAAAQAAANKDAAIASQELNLINQYTPYGNVEYTKRGTSDAGTPQYSATQTLSPSQQALFNLQNDASIRYGQVANNQLNNVANRLSSPLTLGPGQSTGNAGGEYGATRFRTENVAAPEFVPPTAAPEGAGNTRTIYNSVNVPGSGDANAVASAKARYDELQGYANNGVAVPPGFSDSGEFRAALNQAQQAYQTAQAGYTPASTRQDPVQQTFNGSEWVNTDTLPQGWTPGPTPDQIEQARVQWLLDNPPTTQQIGQTYTPNGWVDTSTLPEGWMPPTASTTPTDSTGGGFSLGANGLPAAPVANEATRQSVYDAIVQRNQPQADRARAALETRLANQGIGYGTDAYSAAMADYNAGQNDFNLAAQQAALSQMAQLYGLEANSRDRAVNEMVMERNQPLNELAAMLTGSQVQNPQFINTPSATIAPADIMGATYANYNGQVNAANAAAQARNAGLGGLGNALGTAGSLAMYAWSDRRLKRDISQIGFLPNGLPVYLFKYNWDDEWHMGLMADEVREVNPDAVLTTLSGFDVVNYAEAVR